MLTVQHLKMTLLQSHAKFFKKLSDCETVTGFDVVTITARAGIDGGVERANRNVIVASAIPNGQVSHRLVGGSNRMVAPPGQMHFPVTCRFPYIDITIVPSFYAHAHTLLNKQKIQL